MPRCCISAKSKGTVKTEKIRLGERRSPEVSNTRYARSPRESEYSSAQRVPRAHTVRSTFDRPGPGPRETSRKPDRDDGIAAPSPRPKENKKFPNQDFVVSDCWQSNSDEIPVKLIELFKETNLDSDRNNTEGRQKIDEGTNEVSPPYTKEFHILTEVQKARILKVVEDVVKKLANDDCFYVTQNQEERPGPENFQQTTYGRFFCRKFYLPWATIKVVEMILCHLIQIVFLSEESYFLRKSEFLPVVVTYYVTLFIIIISLVAQLSCFNYGEIQNPCYFMGIVSSSILTFITSLGLIIMLSSMAYYKSFLQILVLVLVGFLLCLLFAELCLFYVEVKNIWNKVGFSENSYDT